MADNKKILFLDIDGVMNNSSDGSGYFCHQPDTYGLSSRNLECLFHLLDKTGAKVVVSSDWRKHPVDFVYHYHNEGYRSPLPSLLKALGEYDVEVCQHLNCSDKWEDILAWLNCCGERIEEIKFAIVDDNEYHLSSFNPNFFLTDRETGLTEELADRIAEWLNTGK